MRSSWLTLLTNSSFSRSSCCRVALARRSSSVVASSCARLLLQPAAVLADLRGFVDDAHDLLDCHRPLAGHRRHQHMRRGAADHAGQQAFDAANDARGRPAARAGRRRGRAPAHAAGRGRAAGPMKRPSRAARSASRRAPAPGAGLARRAANTSTKARACARSKAEGRDQHGQPDQQADIGQHGPEQAVGDRVEPGQPEQRLRPGPGPAEQAGVEVARGAGCPDSASEGRNSVQAHTRNPAAMPASAPSRVAPRQNSAQHDRRRELRGGAERHQPDRRPAHRCRRPAACRASRAAPRRRWRPAAPPAAAPVRSALAAAGQAQQHRHRPDRCRPWC